MRHVLRPTGRLRGGQGSTIFRLRRRQRFDLKGQRGEEISGEMRALPSVGLLEASSAIEAGTAAFTESGRRDTAGFHRQRLQVMEEAGRVTQGWPGPSSLGDQLPRPSQRERALGLRGLRGDTSLVLHRRCWGRLPLGVRGV